MLKPCAALAVIAALVLAAVTSAAAQQSQPRQQVQRSDAATTTYPAAQARTTPAARPGPSLEDFASAGPSDAEQRLPWKPNPTGSRFYEPVLVGTGVLGLDNLHP